MKKKPSRCLGCQNPEAPDRPLKDVRGVGKVCDECQPKTRGAGHLTRPVSPGPREIRRTQPPPARRASTAGDDHR